MLSKCFSSVDCHFGLKWCLVKPSSESCETSFVRWGPAKTWPLFCLRKHMPLCIVTIFWYVSSFVFVPLQIYMIWYMVIYHIFIENYIPTNGRSLFIAVVSTVFFHTVHKWSKQEVAPRFAPSRYNKHDRNSRICCRRPMVDLLSWTFIASWWPKWRWGFSGKGW